MQLESYYITFQNGRMWNKLQKVKYMCIRIGKNVEGNCDYYRRICLEKYLMIVGLWARNLVPLPSLKLQNCHINVIGN